jgi:hypothetical protein
VPRRLPSERGRAGSALRVIGRMSASPYCVSRQSNRTGSGDARGCGAVLAAECLRLRGPDAMLTSGVHHDSRRARSVYEVWYGRTNTLITWAFLLAPEVADSAYRWLSLNRWRLNEIAAHRE